MPKLNNLFKSLKQEYADQIEIVKIVGIYVLFGGAWIYFSDTFLNFVIHDQSNLTQIAIFKGLAFIIITATLLYSLINDYVRGTRKAEALVIDNEQKFRSLYHAISDAVFVYKFSPSGEKGTFVEVNDVACQWLGFSRNELLQRSPSDLISGNSSGCQQLLDTLSVRSEISTDCDVLTKDGHHIPVEIHGQLFHYQGQQAILLLMRDITQRLVIEKRKEAFISIASHELKTPLTVVKAYGQMMKKYFADNKQDTPYKYCVKLNYKIESLETIINRVLDVNQMNLGKIMINKEYFDIKKMLQETCNNLQEITHSHNIVLDCPVRMKVYADKVRIKQVVINTVTNAIKYSPNAKEVWVKADSIDGYVRISVTDFGIGISKKQQEKIFEQYFQVGKLGENPISGLGLGLYVTKQIIDSHHGKISVESKEGTGSTFRFMLPVEKPKHSN